MKALMTIAVILGSVLVIGCDNNKPITMADCMASPTCSAQYQLAMSQFRMGSVATGGSAVPGVNSPTAPSALPPHYLNSTNPNVRAADPQPASDTAVKARAAQVETALQAQSVMAEDMGMALPAPGVSDSTRNPASVSSGPAAAPPAPAVSGYRGQPIQPVGTSGGGSTASITDSGGTGEAVQ